MKLQRETGSALRLLIGVSLISTVAVSTNIIESASAKTFSLGTESASKITSPEPVFMPEPKIPAELHENCFKSCCIAKFLVSASGKTDVKLLSSSGSSEIDEITLQTLRTWKFKPATLDGDPVEGVRKIQIEFQVD